jgi:aminoglycoside phosphotransferase (APT) family kinase protein
MTNPYFTLPDVTGMLSTVDSPTQRAFGRADVEAAVATCFPGRAVRSAVPLTGGSFGTVWRVGLAGDQDDLVLKVGPDPAARLLRYEAGMLAAEAEYLRLAAGAPGVPTPRLLAERPDYLFMSLIPGVPMPDLPSDTDTRAVRFDSGAAIARLHGVRGPFFGYAGPRARGGTWPEAFRAMVEAVLDDAVDWDVTLPVAPDAIRSAVAASHDVLAEVTEPVLVHFDLWDGNVLAISDDAGVRLGGLVDGERYLFGDPCIDFASPALFRDIFDDPDDPFVAGYRSVRPLSTTPSLRRRTWLSQLYLYLVMLVEMPSRGLDRHGEHARRWALLADLVTDLLARIDPLAATKPRG